MIYIDSMRLQPIRRILSGAHNDVDVCKDQGCVTESLYTVITVKTDQYKRMMARAMEELKLAQGLYSPFVAAQVWEGSLCLVLRYEQERRLSTYLPSQCRTLNSRQEVARALVRECMASALPPFLLLLSLTSDNLNLTAQDGVTLNYFWDLGQLAEGATQRDCAIELAELVGDLYVGLPEKALRNNKSWMLVSKKRRTGHYGTILQLYRDLDSFDKGVKGTPLQRLKLFCLENQDVLFLWGRRLAVVLAVVALCTLLFSFLFRNISIFGIKYTGLEQIGSVRLG